MSLLPTELDKIIEENEKLLEKQGKLMREKEKLQEKNKKYEDILFEMKHSETCRMETCNHIMENSDLLADLDNHIIPGLPAGTSDSLLSETKHKTQLNNVTQEVDIDLPSRSEEEVRNNSVHDFGFKTDFKYDVNAAACLDDSQLFTASADVGSDHDFTDSRDEHNILSLLDNNESCFNSRFSSTYHLQQYRDLVSTDHDSTNKNYNVEENDILPEDRLSFIGPHSEISFEHVTESEVLGDRHEDCCQSLQKVVDGRSKQTYSLSETSTHGRRFRFVKRRQAEVIKHKSETNSPSIESIATSGKEIISMKSKNNTHVNTATDEASACELVQMTTAGMANADGPKKEITTADSVNSDGLKEEITTADTTNVDSPKEEITTVDTTNVNDPIEAIATADTANVDSQKEEIITADTTKVDGSKEEITTVDTANVGGSKEEITTVDTANVDGSKEEITTVDTANVGGSKEVITTVDTANVDGSKQEITTVYTANVDGSNEEITTAKPANVDSPKDNYN